METPCKKCKDCIVQIQDFAGAQALETNLTLVANAFAVACKSYPFNRPAATCDAIKAFINLKGNVGKRAGALCGLLESCAAGVGTDCIITAGSLTGPLDVCSMEGVQGGQAVPGVQTTEGRHIVEKSTGITSLILPPTILYFKLCIAAAGCLGDYLRAKDLPEP